MSTFAAASTQPASRGGWRWLVGALRRVIIVALPAVAGLGLAAGCAGPAKPAPPKNVAAIVVVENHTDFAWRVSFTPLASGSDGVSNWQEIKPREMRSMDLRPGVYRVRREVVGYSPQRDPGRDIVLAGDRTYTWPLATLFSIDGVEP